MNAVVITDQFDNTVIKKHLTDLLKEYEVKEAIEFKSYDDLRHNFNTLNQDDKYLFFSSINIRYRNFPQIVENVKKADFDIITVDNYIAAFKPKYLKVMPMRIIPKDNLLNQALGINYQNMSYFLKPIMKPLPRIVVYSHNRDIYLKLTLTSLLKSLEHCREVPVTVVINEPTPKVKEVALEIQAKYNQVDVLEAEKNICVGAMSVAIQWHKPSIVFNGEDDFILPCTTSYLYPMWPYQFCDRLEHCQAVAWGVELDNVDIKALAWEDYHPETKLGWEYKYKMDSNDKFVLMCQMMAMKVDYWKKCYVPKVKAALDSSIRNNSYIISRPFLRGYHIGWNQHMDNYFNAEKYRKMIDVPYNETVVYSHKTGEKRTVVLDDVLRG